MFSRRIMTAVDARPVRRLNAEHDERIDAADAFFRRPAKA